MTNNPFLRVSNQVFAFALSTGPLMSTSKKGDSLRTRFYGVAASKGNNAAYNRARGIAVKEEIIVKNSMGLYELGAKGRELLSWAESCGLDLSQVKTLAAKQAER